MKRYFAVLVLMALGPGLRAQVFTYGVGGGLNTVGGHLSEPGITGSGGPGFGINIGATGDYALPGSGNQFSVRGNLAFEYATVHTNSIGITAQVNLGIINFPIDFVYHSPLGHGKWSFGAGPFVDAALFGHYNGSGPYGSFSLKFGSDQNKDDLRRMDYGPNLLAAYQLNDQVLLTAKLDIGLRDVTPDPTDDGNIHEWNFGINFVYILGHPAEAPAH